MSLVTSVKKVVRERLIARAGGIDLSRLDKVPDAVSWPLRRDVMAPSARLQAARDDAPVQQMASLLGLELWLVTGDAECREVLSDTTSYSTDIRPYMGKSGSTTDGDIGGLGFTDPPDHTRLRRLLTPEFTMRRLERLRPGIQAIVDRQIAEIVAAGERSETVDLVPTFAFPIPFLVICDVLGLPDERARDVQQARHRPLRRHPGRARHHRRHRRVARVPARRGGPAAHQPRTRPDRTADPRARRRDHRLRARRSRGRRVHRRSRDQCLDDRAGQRRAARGPRPVGATDRRARPGRPDRRRAAPAAVGRPGRVPALRQARRGGRPAS